MPPGTRLLGFLALAAAALAAAGSLFASPFDANRENAQRASAALLTVRKLEVPTVKEVTALIEAERFAEFEERSQRYERQFAADPLWESPLYKLYAAVDASDAQLQQKLDRWVQSRPNYMSYAARGMYEVSLAYRERGDRAIAGTPRENLEKMAATMKRAGTDLTRALELKQAFVPPYIGLLQIAQAIDGVEAAAAIEQRATRLVPSTYYVRYTYLLNLRPRWGGSYAQMSAYEDGLASSVTLNPRLWSLRGQSWAERAFSARLEGDKPAAIAFYSRALQYGDRLEFLKDRGTLYLETQRYELARKDFSRYRDYDTSDEEVNARLQCLDKPTDPGLCAATNTPRR